MGLGMLVTGSSFILLLAVASTLSAVIGYFAWLRRPAAGTVALALLMAGIAEWSFLYALELASTSLDVMILLAKLQYVGIVIVPVLWVVFALSYSGLSGWLTRSNLALMCSEPMLVLLLVWTNESHGLVWRNMRLEVHGSLAVFAKSYGPGFLVHASYSYVLMVIGSLVLLHSIIHLPKMYRGQIGLLVVGAFAPLLGNAVTITGISPLPYLDLTPPGFAIAGLAAGWSLFRYRLFDIAPVARDAIFENMDDIVLVLDSQDRIVDANPAARRVPTLGDLASIGRPLAEVLRSLSPDLSDPLRALRHCVKGREYDVRVSPLHDSRGEQTGRLLVLRDITDLVQARDKLAEINEQLETMVTERTRDLVEANQALREEVARRTESEQELRSSEEKTSAIIEASPDCIIVVDPSLSVVQCNQATIEMHRFSSKDEIIGKSALVFFSRREAPRAMEALATMLATGSLRNHEFMLVTKDGREFPGEISAKVVSDASGKPLYFVLISKDISSRKRTEELLKRRLRFQEVVTAVSSRFVCPTDFDEAILASLRDIGLFSGANRSYLFLLKPGGYMDNTHEWCAEGVEPQKDMLQDLPSDSFPWWMARLQEGQPLCIPDVSQLPPEASKEREILESQDIKSVLVLPVKIKGALAGFLGFDDVEGLREWDDHDIAILRTTCEIIGTALERKLAEEELRRYSEHLEEMVEEKSRRLREVERLAAIGETAAMVGHDLRNPLQAMMNNLYLAKKAVDSIDDEEAAEVHVGRLLDAMREQVKYLDKIVSDLQDCASVVEPQRVAVDVGSMLGDVLSEIAIPRDIRLSVAVEEGTAMWADPAMMKRVLTNLVLNAIQAMPKGGCLNVSCGREGRYTVISVADTGIGIPEEYLGKIFDPLFTTKPQGQGLGLVVCKRLVEIHGGAITVTSRVGEGSVFSVKIPACSEEAAKGRAEERERNAHQGAGTEHARRSSVRVA